MPNKYSHGLVLSQQQYRNIIINTHPPLSSKPSSSPNSKSRSRSTAPSIHSPSNHSTQISVHSDYLRLLPDPEPEPSYDYASSSHTRRQSFEPTPSAASRFEPTSSERSRPPSDRLRLEPSLGLRIENPPLPPQQLEPTPSKIPHHDFALSHRPNFESSSPERLRLGTTFPLHPTNPRPSLHQKSSSVETQIYAPESTTTSPPPTREHQDQFSLETHEPYSSLPPTHERQHHSLETPLQERQNGPPRPDKEFQHGTYRASTKEPQHVFSMESPEGSPTLQITGGRQERSSSETQRAYLPSPTRDRQQSFIQKTQALASPPLVQGRQIHSPFGTPSSPSFPSARELQDYFSIDTQGSKSVPAAIRDRQDASSMKARSALPTPPQDGQARTSMDMQRLRLPQTQEHQRRPSLGTQHFSYQRRFQTTQESVHGRKQSIDSQITRDRQYPPSLGPRQLSWDQSIKETQHGRRQSIESKTAQERQPRPSSSSQELSLEQFIQESEQIREPSVDWQIYSPQISSYTGKSVPRPTSLANAQRYTPNNTSLEHGPRSRWDRPSKLPDTFASQHRTLLPTSQGSYDKALIETHGFPPERPPSPPATPNSSKSFSLKTQAEGSRRTRPPPPIPHRSARRSPPRQPSVLRSTNSSVVHLPPEPPRPKTSSAIIDPPTDSKKGTTLHSPTFSISTRGSSVNAVTSPQSVSFSNFGETVTSPGRVSFSQSRDRECFEDADLEPLPSDIDYKVLPYENPNVGPAIFRVTQLGLENPVSPRYEEPSAGPASVRATQLGLGKTVSHDRSVSSRSSSFDSAAPPPIGLNRRISHAVAEPHQPRAPKKESKTSLLSFLRSTSTPKAVLYSEATQGKPPVPVSVSRTNVPSIPLLFPGYKGQFPPAQKTQDKGSRPGPEPRTRPSLETRRSAPRSTAHADAAEKRKSWVRGDDFETARGADRQTMKGELERILSRI